MWSKITQAVLLGCGLLAAAGCVNVEYVGQSFPALDEAAPVVIYSPENPMPDKGFRAIGRAMVTLPDNRGAGDIRQELTALAREHGAEAVNVVSIQKIRLGMAAPESGRIRISNWNRDGRNAGGAYIYTNSFGEQAELAAPGKAIYEQQVKALLLVSDKRFEEMQKLYQAERAKLTAAPAAVPPAAQTAEQALDKAVKPLEVSPTAPAEAAAPAKQPVNVELSSDSNPAVAL